MRLAWLGLGWGCAAPERLLTTFEQYDPIDDDATDYYSLRGEWTKNWSQTAQVYVRAGEHGRA